MIIVTGTKRSGTSMWMQLLHAGGESFGELEGASDEVICAFGEWREFVEREFALLQPERQQAGIGQFSVESHAAPGLRVSDAALNCELFQTFDSGEPEEVCGFDFASRG